MHHSVCEKDTTLDGNWVTNTDNVVYSEHLLKEFGSWDTTGRIPNKTLGTESNQLLGDNTISHMYCPNLLLEELCVSCVTPLGSLCLVFPGIYLIYLFPLLILLSTFLTNYSHKYDYTLSSVSAPNKMLILGEILGTPQHRRSTSALQSDSWSPHFMAPSPFPLTGIFQTKLLLI